MKKRFNKKRFKKIIRASLTVSLVLCITFSGWAQSTEANNALNIGFGAKIGTTISTFTNEQPHSNSLQGLKAGVFANYSFNENMAVQIEAEYSQEGGRLLYHDVPYLVGQDTWYNLDIENQELVLHNVNIPILFKYTLSLKNFDVVGLIGPDVGYNITAIANKEGTVFTEVGGFNTYKSSEDVSSNIENFNVAATAGLGIEIPAGKFDLLIDVRYRYGFTSVYNSYSYIGIPQINGDLRNHTMSFTLGVGF
ncbi:MAG: PorT family protein [Bacteroidales bacterium]|nr:PorT family protein [Bacteroidales bacterium]